MCLKCVSESTFTRWRNIINKHALLMTAKVKYVDGKTFIFTEHFWQWNFMLQQYDFTPNVMGGGNHSWGWVPAIVGSPVWESRQLRAEEERWRWCECHQGSQSVGQQGIRAFSQGGQPTWGSQGVICDKSFSSCVEAKKGSYNLQGYQVVAGTDWTTS